MKKVIKDNVIMSIIIIQIFAAIAWLGFFTAVYPLQWTSNGTLATIAIIASFIMLFVASFYLYRMYTARLYRLRIIESRRQYKQEMKRIEENWDEIYDLAEETEVG